MKNVILTCFQILEVLPIILSASFCECESWGEIITVCISGVTSIIVCIGILEWAVDMCKSKDYDNNKIHTNIICISNLEKEKVISIIAFLLPLTLYYHQLLWAITLTTIFFILLYGIVLYSFILSIFNIHLYKVCTSTQVLYIFTSCSLNDVYKIRSIIKLNNDIAIDYNLLERRNYGLFRRMRKM